MRLFNPYPVLRQVIVNTRARDESFRGVLWRKRHGYLVLRNAEMLRKGEVVPMVGELVIPADNVNFIQVVG